MADRAAPVEPLPWASHGHAYMASEIEIASDEATPPNVAVSWGGTILFDKVDDEPGQGNSLKRSAAGAPSGARASHKTRAADVVEIVGESFPSVIGVASGAFGEIVGVVVQRPEAGEMPSWLPAALPCGVCRGCTGDLTAKEAGRLAGVGPSGLKCVWSCKEGALPGGASLCAWCRRNRGTNSVRGCTVRQQLMPRGDGESLPEPTAGVARTHLSAVPTLEAVESVAAAASTVAVASSAEPRRLCDLPMDAPERAIAEDGNIAIVPHLREHCTLHPLVLNAMAHCPCCYCYVCDKPVAECLQWSTHAHARRATHALVRFATAILAVGAALPPPPLLPVDGPWSCARVLAEVTNVSAFLQLADPPRGLVLPTGASMRAHQQQTLAFMLARERSTDPAQAGVLLVAARSGLVVACATRGGYVCDEVGMGKTLCAICLVLANCFLEPQPSWMPANGLPLTVWYSEEDGEEPEPMVGFVAWSTVEGMQVKFDDSTELWVDPAEDEWAWGLHNCAPSACPARVHCDREAFAAMQQDNAVCRATLVIAPMSLLGQWADEIRKFAPSLTQLTYHACAHTSAEWAKNRDFLVSKMGSIDIVLTTAAIACKLSSCRFHRIIVDEVHTEDVFRGFGGGKAATAQCSPFPGLQVTAPNVWLLTGTPITRGVSDMEIGARLLGQWDFGLGLGALPLGPELSGCLRELMVRHTKNMKLGGAHGGAPALALPQASVQTVWLAMNEAERAFYEHACEADARPAEAAERAGGKDMTLEMSLRCRRQACSNVYKFKGTERVCSEQEVLFLYRRERKPGCLYNFEYFPKTFFCTKLRALRDDLLQLRTLEPSCSAVIFTQHRESHAHITKMLQIEVSAFKIFEIHGATSAALRHAAVRAFQGGTDAHRKCAKVLVTTVRVGSVGMTLTGASRVYLMEPSFDPAAEAQAAGRIHRLGQIKDVHIKRFVFRDSLDERICALHDALRSGSVVITGGVVPPHGVLILTQPSAYSCAHPSAWEDFWRTNA